MFVPSGIRKPAEYLEARRLRAEGGLPYKRIAAQLGVSADSVFHWTRDIPISDEQRRRNLAHMTPNSEVVMKRAATWRAINRTRRLAYQVEGRKRARRNDPLHQAGCMLYWAEGAKDRNNLKLTNSDPYLLRSSIASLRGHILNHLPTSSSGRKTNKLPYGVCTLRVAQSTQLVQHFYGAIQEYAGFEEPRWLDGPPRKTRTPAS